MRLLAGGLARAVPLLLLLAGAADAQDTRPPEPESGEASETVVADAASPVSAQAVASKDEVTVGETFTIEVKVTGPVGTEYTFPAGASEDAIEMRALEAEPATAAAGGGPPAPEPGTQRYEAAIFALGEVQLPPIPVRYRLPEGTEGETETEPITMRIVSLLPKDPDQQTLADIRAPRPATTGRQLLAAAGRAFWIVQLPALLLGAGLIALLLWLRHRRVREPGVASLPETPPDVEALRALAELTASGLLAGGAYRTFYIRLTTIAKRYLERRLEAPVLEMTTAETVAFLRDHPHGGELLPAVRDLAQAADQIKFARGQGLAEAAERHLAAVRALVPALEARLKPAEAAPAEEGRAA